VIEEFARKKLIQDHSRLLNAADVDGLLALYADDVTFEDPVGSVGHGGRAALRAHFDQAVAARVHEVAGEPVAAQDGGRALMPVTAVMDYLPRGPVFAERGWLTAPADPGTKRLRCEYLLMIRTGPGGLIREMKAFWGRTDLEVID
jgi:steroid delta-isomerase